MTDLLSSEVQAQLDTLAIEPGRPLLICDADEVLLQFLRGLEAYLEERDLYLDLSSFALTGNVRRRGDDEALPAEAVKQLLAAFFADRVAHLEPVPGAREALEGLSARMQVVVLSNVPGPQRAKRQQALLEHGMPYPVVANLGSKGAAVCHMTRALEAPAFFFDDLPRHIASVAAAAAEVVRVHFVADPRLARLIGPAEEAHTRCDDWPTARDFLERRLTEAGF